MDTLTATPSPSDLTQDASRNAWRHRHGTLVLVSITLITMARLLVADFSLIDDPGTIYENPILKGPALAALKFYWGGWRTGEYGLYIPVTYTAWIGLAKLARLDVADLSGSVFNPLVFHAANVFAHVIAVLCVRRILSILLRNDRAAVVGAILFAVHPLQVEAVGWTSGLKDVLSGALSLGAIALYIRSASPQSDVNSLRSKKRAYSLGLFIFVLAMLSKPSAMTMPAVAFVLDGMLVRRNWRRAALSILPWVLTTIPFMVHARFIQPASEVRPVPLLSRPLVVGDSIAFYLGKLFWPMDLAIGYDRTPAVVLGSPMVYPTFLFPVVLLTLLLICRRPAGWILTGFLVFVIAPMPTLGWVTLLFQQFSTVADHYLYTAMLGPAIVLGWLMAQPARRWRNTIVYILIAALSIRSIVQTGVWQDSVALLGNSVRIAPHSVISRVGLSVAYTRAGRYDEAIDQCEHVLQIDPDNSAALDGLGHLYPKQFKFAEARDALARAVRLKEAMPPEKRPANLEAQRRNLRELEDYLRGATTSPASRPGD